ncbi:GNAT family N-acetyltransferase [Williamsia sp. CHRR-6]|uniref:GNAT family N-acetyltransferase n=1 Tax=Williamsia sp. CHRR-6 TaxID=2835871 RepID=UPI001BD95078|nr:GNAT family N-acetyltransferase [Williamsia sp. CHRR-6]MBT0565858.1 GNAT family N-acetyltransferase [Williamsia sp. CHRR-6]
MTRDDFPDLSRWLATPEVRRWWNHDVTPEAVERDFGAGVDGTEPGETLIVECDSQAIGLLLRYRLVDYAEYAIELAAVIDPMPPGAYSMDYLIGEPELIGRGLGTAIVAHAAADLFATVADADFLLVPVVAANRRSWRALQNAGFRIIADTELAPDNPIDNPLHFVLRLDRPHETVTPTAAPPTVTPTAAPPTREN